MRMIGNILLKENLLDKDEKFVHMEALCKQIEYYMTNDAESAECVSLIPVLDLIMPTLNEKGFEEADLRKKGFILNLSDLFAKSAQVCDLADNDSYIYNSRLKRLHEAYFVFMRNYAKGLVENNTIKEEIISHFSKILKSFYTYEIFKDKELSKELREQIANLLRNEVESITLKWFEGALNQEQEKELVELFTERLLIDWEENKLPAQIQEKLEASEVKSHSTPSGNNDTTARLLEHFRNKKLAPDVQKMIQEALINEINKELTCGNLTVHAPLGAAYKITRKSEIRGKCYVIPTMIENWQNRQFEEGASKDLEKYATAIIETKMKDKKSYMESKSSIVQQFKKLAVEIFLEHIQQNNYSQELMYVVREYTQNIATETLLGDQHNDNSACVAEVFKNSMRILHDQWVEKKLSLEKSMFIEEEVFADLHAMDDKIKERIWRNKIFVQGSETQGEVINLRTELAEVRQELQLFKNLVKQLKQLTTQTKEMHNYSEGSMAVAVNDDNDNRLGMKAPSATSTFFNR